MKPADFESSPRSASRAEVLYLHSSVKTRPQLSYRACLLLSPYFFCPAGKTLVAAAAACLLNAAVSQAQEFPPMEFVIPLYIAPILNNGTLGEGMSSRQPWTTICGQVLPGGIVPCSGALSPSTRTITGSLFGLDNLAHRLV